jgi:transposase-like protein
MERLSAPERTREELRALMNGELGTATGRSDLVRLALRLIVEEALEGEVADVLGRERYERGDGEKAGYRNGYRPGKVKTAEGAVHYSAPQVRDTPEPFVSGVRAALSGRTRELERLAVELYARGLSTRDIEDTFTDETGRRLLSRAAVSEITEKLWARQLATGIRTDYANVLPSALTCFEDDFEACIAHLRLPVTHRRFVRTTNLLERLFVEERRRLKIIPNGFGEKPVLKLMFGALIRAAERWRGLRFTERAVPDRRRQKGPRRRISDLGHAAGKVIPTPFRHACPKTIEIPRSRSDCEPRVRGRPCRGASSPPPYRRRKSGFQRPISAYGRGLGAQGRFLAAPSPRDRNRHTGAGRRA